MERDKLEDILVTIPKTTKLNGGTGFIVLREELGTGLAFTCAHVLGELGVGDTLNCTIRNDNFNAIVVYKSPEERLDFGIIRVERCPPMPQAQLSCEPPVIGTKDEDEMTLLGVERQGAFNFNKVRGSYEGNDTHRATEPLLTAKCSVTEGMSGGPAWHAKSKMIIGIIKGRMADPIVDKNVGMLDSNVTSYCVPMSEIFKAILKDRNHELGELRAHVKIWQVTRVTSRVTNDFPESLIQKKLKTFIEPDLKSFPYYVNRVETMSKIESSLKEGQSPIIIIGNTGMGKTSLMKKLAGQHPDALFWLLDTNEGKLISQVIIFREKMRSKFDIDVNDIVNFDASAAFKQILEKGNNLARERGTKFIIGIDGLDQQPEFQKTLENLNYEEYPYLTIIVATRPPFLENEIRGRILVNIFSDNEATAFISKYLQFQAHLFPALPYTAINIFTEKFGKKIVQQTKGHPQYLKCILNQFLKGYQNKTNTIFTQFQKILEELPSELNDYYKKSFPRGKNETERLARAISQVLVLAREYLPLKDLGIILDKSTDEINRAIPLIYAFLKNLNDTWIIDHSSYRDFLLDYWSKNQLEWARKTHIKLFKFYKNLLPEFPSKKKFHTRFYLFALEHLLGGGMGAQILDYINEDFLLGKEECLLQGWANGSDIGSNIYEDFDVIFSHFASIDIVTVDLIPLLIKLGFLKSWKTHGIWEQFVKLGLIDAEILIDPYRGLLDASKITSNEIREKLILKTINELSARGDFDFALKVTSDINSPQYKCAALLRIGEKSKNREVFNKILQLITNNRRNMDEELILNFIVISFNLNFFSEMMEGIKFIEDPRTKACSYFNIAEKMVLSKNILDVGMLFKLGWEAISNITDPHQKTAVFQSLAYIIEELKNTNFQNHEQEMLQDYIKILKSEVEVLESHVAASYTPENLMAILQNLTAFYYNLNLKEQVRKIVENILQVVQKLKKGDDQTHSYLFAIKMLIYLGLSGDEIESRLHNIPPHQNAILHANLSIIYQDEKRLSDYQRCLVITWEQVQKIMDVRQEISTYCDLSMVFASNNQIPEAFNAISKGVTVIQSQLDDGFGNERNSALGEFINVLLKIGDFDRALEIVTLIQDHHLKILNYAEIIRQSVLQKAFDKGKEILEYSWQLILGQTINVTPTPDTDWEINSFILELRSDYLEDFKDYVKTFPREIGKIWTYLELASFGIEAEEYGKSIELLAEIRIWINDISSFPRKNMILLAICKLYLTVNKPQKALNILRSLDIPIYNFKNPTNLEEWTSHYKVILLSQTAILYAQMENLHYARLILDEVREQISSSHFINYELCEDLFYSLGSLIKSFARHGYFSQAIAGLEYALDIGCGYLISGNSDYNPIELLCWGLLTLKNQKKKIIGSENFGTAMNFNILTTISTDKDHLDVYLKILQEKTEKIQEPRERFLIYLENARTYAQLNQYLGGRMILEEAVKLLPDIEKTEDYLYLISSLIRQCLNLKDLEKSEIVFLNLQKMKPLISGNYKNCSQIQQAFFEETRFQNSILDDGEAGMQIHESWQHEYLNVLYAGCLIEVGFLSKSKELLDVALRSAVGLDAGYGQIIALMSIIRLYIEHGEFSTIITLSKQYPELPTKQFNHRSTVPEIIASQICIGHDPIIALDLKNKNSLTSLK